MAVDIKKLSRFSRNLAMLAGLGVFVAIASWEAWYLLFHTSYFQISRIEVTGCERVEPDLVKNASGLTLARNAFSIDLNEAQRRILDIPQIDFARVERDSLDTVRITVRERRAVALLLMNGIFHAIDAECTVFEARNSAVRVDLPIVTGITLDAVDMGKRIEDLRVVEAVRWVSQLSPEHFTRISEVHFEGPILSLVLVSGETVYPGDAANFRRLYNLLVATLEKFRHQNVAINYLDMRFNGEIVVKPANI